MYVLQHSYCSVLSRWEFFIKMRAACCHPPSRTPLFWRKEGAKQAAFILMKISHFYRICIYLQQKNSTYETTNWKNSSGSLMSETCDLLNAMHRSSSLIKKWNAFYLTAKWVQQMAQTPSQGHLMCFRIFGPLMHSFNYLSKSATSKK